MNSSLSDSISSLYAQTTNQVFNEFKSSTSNQLKQKQYELYYTKCINELTQINTDEIEAKCHLMQEAISNRMDSIAKTKMNLISNSVNVDTSADSLSIENYVSNTNSLKNQYKVLLDKIDQLELDSPLDSMKKAKTEYDNSNQHLILQPLLTSLIEKRKFFDLVNKEKISKHKILEEKQATFNENKAKIEKLTKEYNVNSSRMEKELDINNSIQKGIDKLSSDIANVDTLVGSQDEVINQRIEEIKQNIEKNQGEIKEMKQFLEKTINNSKAIYRELVGLSLWMVMKRLKKEKELGVIVKEKMKKISYENDMIINSFKEKEMKCKEKMKEKEPLIKERDYNHRMIEKVRMVVKSIK